MTTELQYIDGRKIVARTQRLVLVRDDLGAYHWVPLPGAPDYATQIRQAVLDLPLDAP